MIMPNGLMERLIRSLDSDHVAQVLGPFSSTYRAYIKTSTKIVYGSKARILTLAAMQEAFYDGEKSMA